MDILAPLVPALNFGLGIVAEEIIKKLVEVGSRPAAEQLDQWLHQGYDAGQKLAALQQAMLVALDELCQDPSLGSVEQLVMTLRLTGLPAELRQVLAAAAVEMVLPDEQRIPEALLQQLDLPVDKRALLARFLFLLRKHLGAVPGYQTLIANANDLDRRGQLAGIADQLMQIVLENRRASSYREKLALDRRLSLDDQEAAKAYLEQVKQEWGSLMLPLIRKQSGQTAVARLPQVFVPLFVRDELAEAEARQKAEALSRQKGELRQAEEEQVRPVNFNLLLARYHRFILIGSPGCGKTTLLRRAALAFAEGRAELDLGWEGKPLLPVFLRLRHFGAFLAENRAEYPGPSSSALIACLEQHYRTGERIALTPDFFDRRLQEGGCLVLLDGLDEVTQNRVEVAQHVNAFIEKYARRGNRVGLSSRPKGYEGDARLQLSGAGLAQAVVTPLDPGGIQQLIANLLQFLEPDLHKRGHDLEALNRAILGSTQLTEIAGTPLFCSALVQVYKYHGAELPQRRVDVLAEIVDLLLGFWHAQQRVPDPQKLAQEDGTEAKFRDIDDAVQHKLRRLSHIAYHMQAEAHRADLDAETARQVLAEYLCQRERVSDIERARQWAENFLYNSHERSGLLVESNPGTYAFVHQNFMEYLAATALVNRSSQLVPTVLQHLEDGWWEQVILLAGAHPKTPEDVREELVSALLQAAQESESGSERWLRALKMAGWQARDMAGYLAGQAHEAVEKALQVHRVDPDLKPVLRAELAEVLDALWLPPDLDCFVPVPDAQNPSFWIAKYPLTNVQYERFLNAPDYAERRYWVDFPKYDEHSRLMKGETWGEAGWRWLQEKLHGQGYSPDGKRVLPRYWNDPRFGITRRAAPLVGVSWYEANACCKWLLAHWQDPALGLVGANPGLTPAALRLPTDAEWVQAAGGAQGDRYPWDTPGQVTAQPAEIIKRANVDENGIRRTTPVGMYPQGASLCGVWDLAGNVWEWQANYLDKDHDVMVLRGGSWDNYGVYARCAYHYRDLPDSFSTNDGFRLLLSPD